MNLYSSLEYLDIAYRDLSSDWHRCLMPYCDTLHHIDHALQQFNTNNITIYPNRQDIFRAIREIPSPSAVRVVILGQDPYHGKGQAEGLAFSVPNGCPIPPSLRNIFKEYQTDLGLPTPTTSSLLPWAQQGVLLLNTCLTVTAGQAGSHAHLGWQTISRTIIDIINRKSPACVFILWGNWAHPYAEYIDTRHFVIKSTHPSPLSAYRGFFGHRPFSQANQWLISKCQAPIKWQLP